MQNLLKDFEQHLQRKQLSRSTVRNYKTDLKLFLNWYNSRYGTFSLEEIKPYHLDQYLKSAEQEKKTASSIKRYKISLYKFFTWTQPHYQAPPKVAFQKAALPAVSPAPRSPLPKFRLALARLPLKYAALATVVTLSLFVLGFQSYNDYILPLRTYFSDLTYELTTERGVGKVIKRGITLAEEAVRGFLEINVPVEMNRGLTASTVTAGAVTAGNLTYTVTAGDNISVFGGQNPVVSISDDSLDFSALKDALTLDNSTEIALGANTLTFSGSGQAQFSNTGGLIIAGTVDLDNTLDLDSTLDLDTSSTTALTVGDGTTDTLAVDTSGDVVNVNGDLEVEGQVKIAGGTPGTSKVLTSDSVGLATWQALSGLGVTSVTGTTYQITASPTSGDVVLSLPSDLRAPGTVNAVSNIISTGGVLTISGTGDSSIAGNLGIGTTSPDTKLHVVGDVYIASDSGYSFDNPSSDSDLYVEGTLEVEGSLFVNDSSTFTGTMVKLNDNVELQLGSSSDARFVWETADTDTHYLSTVLTNNMNWIISADSNIDWGRSAASDPTLYIQSADETTTSDYLALYHDQTNARIDSGGGDIVLTPAGDVVITDGTELYSFGSAALGNRTYTQDNYVTDAETFTASVEALDQGLAAVSSGAAGLWQDNTTYIYASNVSGGDVVIADDGNVGIGTTDPSYKLDVQGTINVTGATTLNGVVYTWPGSDAAISGSALTSNGSGTLGWTDLTGSGSGDVGAWTLSGNNLYPDSTSYSVGIGNTGPSYTLDVTGAGRFTTGGYIDAVQIGISGAGEIDTSSGNLTIDSAGGTVIIDDILSVSSTSSFSGDVNLTDDIELQFGGSDDVRLLWETADADNHYLSTILSGSMNWIISADNGIDWGRAASTNPTLFIQSADQGSTGEYLAFFHDQTDATINVGSGKLHLAIAGGSKLTIDTGGYVGIGTTNPLALLHVGSAGSLGSINGVDDLYVYDDLEVGGTVYGNVSGDISGDLNPGFTQGSVVFMGAAGLAEDSANFFWDDGSNYLGVGTSAPGAKLDVVGQCVTGDSELITEDGGALRVDEVKGGERVYSLDESTGQLVPAEITALLNMGIKPVYKLQTESGKAIETTGNHPYLMRGTSLASLRSQPISNNSQKRSNQGQGSSKLSNSNTIPEFINTHFESRNKKTDRVKNSVPNNNAVVNINNQSGLLTISSAGEANTNPNQTAERFWQTAASEVNHNTLITPNVIDSSVFVKQNNASWTKVTYLHPGMEIAVADMAGKQAVWDKIVSIEYVGEKQVWDLSIEGTHNFVANGIVAHNTYISGGSAALGVGYDPGTISGGVMAINGNVGIGDTGPDAKLEVLSTSEQLRLTHTDGTYDAHFTVDGSGNLAIQATADLYFQPDDDTDDYLTLSSDGADLTIGTAGSANLTIDSGGTLTISDSTTFSSTLLLSDGSASSPSLSFSGDTNIGLYRITEDKISLITGGTVAQGLTIDSGGNVGIGTTGPGELLDVVKDQNSSTTMRVYNNTGGTAAWGGYRMKSNSSEGLLGAFDDGYTGVSGYEDNIVLRANASSASKIVLEAADSSGEIVFNTGGSGDSYQRVVIDNNGNVGIGTTGPGAGLEISKETGTPFLVRDTTSGVIYNIEATGGWVNNYLGRMLISPGSGIAAASDAYLKLATTTTHDSYVHYTDGDINFYSGLGGSADKFFIGASLESSMFSMDTNGNVGIGTTNPVQKLHVEGHCVTGDTLLPTLSSAPSTGQEADGSWLIADRTQIKDVKSGMYTYSLDEKTGKIVPAKVKGLFDMGTKPVFEIKTASGQSVKTTGNHPYLVKLDGLTCSSLIADSSSDDMYNETNQQPATSNRPFTECKYQEGGEVDGSSIIQLRAAEGVAERYGLDEEDLSEDKEFSQIRTVWLDGSDSQGSGLDSAEYSRGTGSAPSSGVYPVSVSRERVTLRDNNLSETSTEFGILEGDGSTTTTARSTPDSQTTQRFDQSSPGTKASWIKVIYLREGDQIAVPHQQPATSNQPYVLWDTIVSIEYIGEEQVYDIEVEGTHNFIANGIIAHNTYISGNVGIGTTGPAQKLEVAGNIVLGVAGSAGNYLYFPRPSSGFNQIEFDYAGDPDKNFLRYIRSGSYQMEMASAWGIDMVIDSINDSTTDVFRVLNNGIGGTGTELFRVQENGNVGIGSTSPSAPLTINSTTGPQLRIEYDGSNYFDFDVQSDGGLFMGQDGDAEQFSLTGGRLGIGTTGPGYKLDVSGTGRFTGNVDIQGGLDVTGGNLDMGTNVITSIAGSGTITGSANDFNIYTGTNLLMFGVGGANTKMVIDNSGNVGIGTTSPVQKLHVEGQCVTGDTLLYTASSNPDTGQDSSQLTDHSSQIQNTPDGVDHRSQLAEIEKIQIKDVKEGTLVYSLNEDTGKVEPRRINRLLDMGVKPVFKLITETGKEIRTTGNHPYLVQLTQDELQQRIQLRETGSLEREYGLSQGSLSTDYEFSQTRDVWSSRSTKESSNLNTAEYSGGEWEVLQEGVYPVSLSRSGQSLRSGRLPDAGAGTEVSNTPTSAAADSEISPNQSNDGRTDNLPEKTIWSKVIYLSPGDKIAVVSDSVHRSQITDHSKDSFGEPRTVNSEPVSEADNIGEPSTVNSEPYVLWDTIVSIEYIGEEQVYDIEVEGTHNFIANGIIAHNTYISGNVGIGTTGPGARLHTVSSQTVQDDETGSSWGPANHGLSLADGVAFLRVNGVDLSTFAGTEGSDTPYMVVLTDDAGSKVAWGYIGNQEAAEGLDTEKLGNIGFEIAGGGGDDIFGSWAEDKGDGAIADEGVLVHGGSHAAKITGGATPLTSPRISQILAVNPGKLYKITFWARGDGTNAGRYSIFDVSNAAWIHLTVSTGVSAATYAEVNIYVTAPSGCSSMGLYLQSPNVNGGITYFDDVSFKEVLHAGADAVHIVSTKDGSTRNWAGIEGGFDYNDSAYTFDILSTSQSLAKMDWNSSNLYDFTSGGFSLYDIDGNENTRISTLGDSFFNTGNVGIGTTGPTSNLHVVGTIYGTTSISSPSFIGASFGSRNWANNDTTIDTRSGYGIDFAEAGSSRMYIQATTGNVGIGTTGPLAKLVVSGSDEIVHFLGTADSRVYIIADSTEGGEAGDDPYLLFAEGYNEATGGVSNSWYMGMDNSDSDRFTLGYRAGAGGDIGDNDLVSIDTNGNVGIGTTGPEAKLEVAGGSIRVSLGASELNIAYNKISNDEDNANLYISAGKDLVFQTYIGATQNRVTIKENGNVGIGTTAPAALLEVNSAATTTDISKITSTALTSGKALNIAATGNGYTSGNLINANLTQAAATGTAVSGDIVNIAFSPTYSTAIATPAISGNVLDVSRAAVTDVDFASTLTVSGAVATFSDSATQTQGTLTSTADVVQISQNYSANSGAALNITTAGGGFALRVNDNATFTDTTPFVVDDNGDVGIGTAVPQSLLDVQGPTGAGADSAGIVTIATKELTVEDGDVLGQIDFNAPLESTGVDAILVGASIWAEADDTFAADNNETELVFATGASEVATEKVRITSDGKVGIGTPTPSQALDVIGEVEISGLLGGIVNVGVDANGVLIRQASDANLKEDFAPIEDALDKVLSLEGTSFYWKDKVRFGEQQELGFLAQDVEKIVPQAVRDGPEYKSVSYNTLTALLVEGVKDIKGIQNGVLGTIDEFGEFRAKTEREIGEIKESGEVRDERITALEQTPEATPSAAPDESEPSSNPADEPELGSYGELTIKETLTSIGKTYLADTNIAGTLTVGLITFDELENSIDSLAGPLKLQSNALQNIEFEGGQIVMTTEGDLEVAGTITAEKYEVDTSEVESASLGSAVIPTGETWVVVETTAISASSKIFVTATTLTDRTLAVTEKESGQHFKVEIFQPSDEAIHFDWWIVDATSSLRR